MLVECAAVCVGCAVLPSSGRKVERHFLPPAVMCLTPLCNSKNSETHIFCSNTVLNIIEEFSRRSHEQQFQLVFVPLTGSADVHEPVA